MSLLEIAWGEEATKCEELEDLIKKGADVNFQGKYGKTALHYAVKGERKDCVDILVSNGADVNIQDDDGNTPVHLAAMAENSHENNIWEPIEILNLLLNTGHADLTIQNNDGETPLDSAIEYMEIQGRLFTTMYRTIINNLQIVALEQEAKGNNGSTMEGGKRKAKKSRKNKKTRKQSSRSGKNKKKTKGTRRH